MTNFYLVRHASNDCLPHTLAGRGPGVHLNDAGRREAAELAETLAVEKIQHVFTSPLERCRETAEPIARRLGVEVRAAAEIQEVDFGEWTGRKIAELDLLESWKQWNAFRSGGRTPGGESMLELQARMAGFVDRLRRELPGRRIALVSHGDPIRTVILYYLGAGLDAFRRIELSPASVTVLCIGEWDAQFRCINARAGTGCFSTAP